MITRIQAHRYRCFEELDVTLRPFQVLAGANGAGKSTLMDIPLFLGDMMTAESCLNAWFQPMRGRSWPRGRTLQEMLFMEQGEFVTFALEAKLPEEITSQYVPTLPEAAQSSSSSSQDQWLTHLRYEVQLQVLDRRELHVVQEYLYLFPEGERLGGGAPITGDSVGRSARRVLTRSGGDAAHFKPEMKKGRGYEFRVGPHDLALNSVPSDRTLWPGLMWFSELLKRKCMAYEPDWRALRVACPPGRTATLAPDASNLPWLAMELRKRDAHRYAQWVAHVQTALPQVEAIEALEREEDHHAYFRLAFRGGFQVTSSGLSEGTLNILALTMPPYLAQVNGLLAVEEPEKGIHPRGIEAAMQALSCIYDAQTWVSTQSPLVIAASKLEDILCMRLEKTGAVHAIAGSDHPRMKTWKGEIDLGALFASGVLA